MDENLGPILAPPASDPSLPAVPAGPSDWESLDAVKANRRYRFLAKAIPQIVWTARPDGAFDSFNPRWPEYSGLSVDPLRDGDWRVAVHDEDRPRFDAAWQRALATGTSVTLDIRLRRTDGLYRWHLARGLPVRDRTASVIKWIGTFTDIDEQKQAEGILAFLVEAGRVLGSSLDYETTLRSVAALAVPRIADCCLIDMIEPDGSVKRLAVVHAEDGRAACADDLSKRFPLRKNDPHGPARVLRSGKAEIESALDANRPDTGDSDLRGPFTFFSQELGLRSAMYAPLAARGRMLGVITFAMASSGRRYVAADIRVAEDLARQAAMAVDNARLYQEAQQARVDAETANHAKDDFLAVLSHELRTPLTPVLLAVSALQENPATKQELRPIIDMIRHGVQLQAHLIDDLLDVTKIARGKLTLQSRLIDVHELIGRTVEICRDTIDSGKLKLSLDLKSERPWVMGDQARLHQVVWNLLKNAAKFTPAEGCLTIRTVDLPDGRVAVEVQDTGLGIDPAVLPRIFEAFEQGESRVTRRFGGLGLGLAITRALVVAHGGTIAAESQGKGQGATFRVTLPVAPEGLPAPSGDPTLSSADLPQFVPPSQHRILLVEDDPATLALLGRLLGRQGHVVHKAPDCATACDLAASQAFDLLISDIQLPDGTGHDLLGRIHAVQPLRAIALTGFGMDHDIRQASASGFDAHLTKPIEFPQLLAAIDRVMAR